jgi:hypothetical protein
VKRENRALHPSGRCCATSCLKNRQRRRDFHGEHTDDSGLSRATRLLDASSPAPVVRRGVTCEQRAVVSTGERECVRHVRMRTVGRGYGEQLTGVATGLPFVLMAEILFQDGVLIGPEGDRLAASAGDDEALRTWAGGMARRKRKSFGFVFRFDHPLRVRNRYSDVSSRKQERDKHDKGRHGRLAELADAQDLGSCAARRRGSSPRAAISQSRNPRKQGGFCVFRIVETVPDLFRRVAQTLL